MARKTYLLPIAFIALCGCGSGKQQAAPEKTPPAPSAQGAEVTAAQVRTAGIETGMPEKSTLYEDLRVNGEVDVPPQNIVSVSFPLGGYLRSTRMLPGMPVSRGQVLGVIEDQSLIQLQQDYLVGKARLQYLEQDFKRQKELNESNVNAGKTFQQAESEFNSQRVTVRANAEKLRLIGIDPDRLSEQTISRSVPIHSPISGFVSRVNVNIGKYVQPSDVLFELINPDDIHAALTVFQKDMPRVKVGQSVDINFINEPDKVYRGRIILANRNLDENRSAVIHCHFDTHPAHLLPGMFLQARIKTAAADATHLPEEAVVNFMNRQYVFVKPSADRYDMVEVQTGIRSNGRIQILNPDALKGLPVVTRNAYAVLGAMKNTAEEEE
jgi:cobalt-zinc-cadmium efflux system membrane fusion protein